jgi:DNA-binding NarL/FixJ family response regulator
MERPRLLLAEDHQGMREIILRLVESEFTVVGEVTDGQALLEAESDLKPDVCVIDISMPVLNGIEAANLLQKSNSRTKIIFLTAYSQRDFLDAALQTGALGYVLKPRMASDLLQAIREVMANRPFISPSILAAVEVKPLPNTGE